MRITLADIQTRPTAINKDLSGGYGTSSDFGNGWAAWLVKRFKRNSVKLPVLMLGYLAAILRARGHEVRVTHGPPIPGTDLYLIYTSLVEHSAEVAFAQRIREEGEAKIGFVGSLASAMPDRFLPLGDFVVAGEAEGALLDLGESIEFHGLVHGKRVEQLDSLPFPDWRPFPYHEFSYAHYLPERPFFPMTSSRGCPYSCVYYCPYPIFQGRQFRMRSVESVVEEIAYLVREYGARSVLFRDPIFTLEKRRVAEIAETLLRRRLNIRWACETHLARLDRELVDVMHAAGCRGINVGVESVSPEVLKSVRRKTDDVQHQEEIIRYCEDKGVKIGAFYIFGNPEDTEETIRSTIAYAKDLNTSYAQFTISTPYPGTQFYEDMKPRLTETALDRFDIYTPTFAHPNMTAETILCLKEEAYAAYYFRWKWLRRYLAGALRQWWQ